MSFVDDALKGLDDVLKAANSFAFGSSTMYDRPIGLLYKDYGFMYHHLMRNIGNGDFTYDGYGTPISYPVNPFYNSIVRESFFNLDSFKNTSSTYLEYVRNVYGATLSVENINMRPTSMRLDDDILSVGSVDTGLLSNYLTTDINWDLVGLVLNPNGTGIDTITGVEGAKHALKTLRSAIITNDKRSETHYSITNNMKSSFGFKTDAIEDNNILNISHRKSKNTGRYGSLSPLVNSSPIDAGNMGTFGNAVSIGDYSGFYDSLSEIQKGYIADHVRRNKYFPRFSLSSSFEDGETPTYTITSDKGYLGRAGINYSHSAAHLRSYNEGIEIDSIAVDSSHIRYVFNRTVETKGYHENIRNAELGDVYVYSENEYGSVTNYTSSSFNGGVRFGRYTSYGELLTADDMLKKTNNAFKNAAYDTIIARFFTNKSTDAASLDDTTQTAISKEYGMSHGRNLLKRTPDESEGYKNPYCRVWTHHHQYHRIADTMRPMQGWTDKWKTAPFTAQHGDTWGDGRTRLVQNGVLNPENGLVNITPIDATSRHGKVDIKNCMFSIENLAWKDVIGNPSSGGMSGGLTPEQIGPFGGRIMWFPPYDISFSENVSVNWNGNEIIGRGEPIYTYTNTTRTGNLHFKLLIDHPSVVDYWENKGKSYSNSVDDIDDPEQELLRFFVGCDDLSSTAPTTPEPEPVIQDEPVRTPTTRKIRFYVFYPNNYSGVDDDPLTAIRYLLNGIGTGKGENGENVLPFTSNQTIQRRTGLTENDWSVVDGYGGYELRPDRGVSIAADNDNHWEYFAKTNGEIISIQRGTNDNKSWWKKKYFYRIDNAYRNQILQKSSYIDKTSYGLNGIYGQSQIIERYSIENPSDLFSLADVYVALNGGSDVLDGYYSPERVNSFKEIINGPNSIEKIEIVGKASVQGYDESNAVLQRNRAQTVKKWLMRTEVSNKVSDDMITCTTGGVGGQGAGVNKGDASGFENKIYRCAEVSIYVKVEESDLIQNTIAEQYKAFGEQPNEEDTNVTKQYIVGTVYGPDKVRYFDDYSGNNDFSEANYKTKRDTMKLHSLGSNIGNLIMNLKESSRNNNLSVNGVYESINHLVNDMKYDDYLINNTINDIVGGRMEMAALNQLHDKATSDTNGMDNSIEDKLDMYGVANGVTDGNGYSIRNGSSKKPQRYDMESRFFELLGKEEPFLHHKISDKVKYFDPAFHSVSPEGFNARLTFLHQCTRQGPTISSSDNNDIGRNNTANNLAFGRPPVCILRIGDFYYTKILIRNLDIQFDPLVWDLNHEGIGVMPMIADVSMSFEFIGGSSLGGHITRLQNALSFNYYANTEVYDDRSELASYSENGDINNFKAFNPAK